MRLEHILGKNDHDGSGVELWEHLPVGTSYKQELAKTGAELFEKHYEFSRKNIQKQKQKPVPKWGEFIPNVDTKDAQNDLVMLKLRGLIDQTKFSRSTEMRKLPKKVQIGTISGGGGFQDVRAKKTKKHNTLVDSLLQLDSEIGYSSRKFVEIQKQKQRKKRITKKQLVKERKGKKEHRSNYE